MRASPHPPSANRRTQACNGGAWAQSRAANPTGALSTSPCLLLSLSRLPTRWREPELRLSITGLWCRPSQASWGPSPLPAPAPCSQLPGELPPTHSLSLAPEQSKLCAGLALLPPASQSKHKTQPQAQPGPTALAGSSCRGGPCTLDLPISAETQNGPQNTLPQTRAQKANNKNFPAQGVSTYWTPRVG